MCGFLPQKDVTTATVWIRVVLRLIGIDKLGVKGCLVRCIAIRGMVSTLRVECARGISDKWLYCVRTLVKTLAGGGSGGTEVVWQYQLTANDGNFPHTLPRTLKVC